MGKVRVRGRNWFKRRSKKMGEKEKFGEKSG